MYISAETLDDLMMKVLKKIIKSKTIVKATRGESREIDGVLLHLSNPRARLSRTEKKSIIFSCLGELLWYLSKGNDLEFIQYYISTYADESEDGKTVYGGYGSRLFNFRGNNQIKNVVELLKKSPTSRRAVIQLFDANDISKRHKEIPCTCTLQFIIREKKLHMFTSMRSNDAFIGLPHDIFCFTMIQEILSRELRLEIGAYKHFVGSLHLYEDKISDAKQYIDEGWQEDKSMPVMPIGNPWNDIDLVIKYESIIRRDKDVDLKSCDLNEYWKDIIRLLLIYKNLKNGKLKNVVNIKNEISTDIYESYIRKKIIKKQDDTNTNKQLDLNLK